MYAMKFRARSASGSGVILPKAFLGPAQLLARSKPVFQKLEFSQGTEQSKKCLSSFFFTINTVASSATFFFRVCVSISESSSRVTSTGPAPEIMDPHPKAHEPFHQKELALRYRGCGRRLPAGKTASSVLQFTDELLVTHSIDVREDRPTQHPSKLCSGCVMHLKRATSLETKQGGPVSAAVERQAQWPECTEDSDCELCVKWQHESKGGRRKRSWWRRGRPTSTKPPVSAEDTSQAASSQLHGAGEEEISASLLVEDPAGPIASRLVRFGSDIHSLSPERFEPVLKQDEQFICPVCKDVQAPLEVPLPNGCEHPCCRDC